MSAAVIGLALFAAILHASWNAFLRNGSDRLWTVTVMSFASTIVALPFLFIYPMPASDVWLYILLSAVLQVGYSVFLVAAYRYGELGQVYPIVRGTVPLLVTLGGFAVAGDRLDPYQIAGVILVALGIMSLALGKGRASTSSILFALATGRSPVGWWRWSPMVSLLRPFPSGRLAQSRRCEKQASSSPC
jgi:drug/metabolite transporter (DMT)-like permease